MPPLLLLEACAIRMRRQVERTRAPARLQRRRLRTLRRRGWVRAPLRVFLRVSGLTVAAAIALRVRVDGDLMRHVIETLAAATIPLVTVALTGAASRCCGRCAPCQYSAAGGYG